MEIKEIIEGKIKVLSEEKTSEGDVMLVRAPWVVVDKQNLNGRTYSQSLIKRETERVQKSIAAGSFIGSADHNETGLATIEDASHIITKLELLPSGIGEATLKILPTEKGKTIQTIIKNDGRLSLSSRGFGNVTKSGNVMDDFRLMGIDVVVQGSTPAATFSKNDVFESLDFEEMPDDKKKEVSESYIQKMLQMSYGVDIDQGHFAGSFEEWKKEKEDFYRAEILFQHGHYNSAEEALIAMGKENLAKKISTENIIEPVTSGQIREEALAAGVDPIIYADRINKSLESQEKVESDEDFTTEQIASLLEEARQAGADTSIKEVRDKVIENARTLKRKKILSRDEQAQLESERTGIKKENILRKWEIDEKEKIKEAKRQRIIREVNRDYIASGGSKYLTVQEMVFKMLEKEDLLTPQEKNWQIFRNILADSKTK